VLEPKKMNRLNELARKKKVGLLTEAEVQEQAALRKEYLAIFRTSMKETLEQTTIIDPAGNDVTPEKVKAIRTRKMVQ